MKITEAEIKIMTFIWDHEEIKATEIIQLAKTHLGWSRTTTYTILKRLIEKNAIEKMEPNFICIPLVSRESVQSVETKHLIDKLYDGSRKMFLSAFLTNEKISKDELEELQHLINELK